MHRPATRELAMAVGCAAFVTVPNVGALVGSGEQTDRYDTVITPPGYAFVVWGPIFAACATDTIARLRGGGEPSDDRTAWPLAAGYALNTTWSIAAQTDRFALTPWLLAAATASTGVAHARLQRVDSARPTTVLATGLLLGWTALATTLNVTADAVRRGAPPEAGRTVAVSTAGLVATGFALVAATATSRRGAVPLAASATWGLGTLACDTRRPRATRALAGLAASALVGAAKVARRQAAR